MTDMTIRIQREDIMSNKKRKCEQCGSITDVIRVVPPADVDELYLCEACAYGMGFCPGCGYAVGGVEWDDMHMNNYGICAQCVEDLRAETAAYDEYGDPI